MGKQCGTYRRTDVLVCYECPVQPGVESEEHVGCRGDRSFCAHALRSAYRPGKKVRLYVPAVSNLLFVHTTDSRLRLFKQTTTFLQYLVRRVDGVSRKIIVPDAQMEQFMRVSRTDDDRLVYLKPEEINLSKGTRVRILGGVFDGVEGLFVRVKGKRNRRVVVLIDHVSAIAVSEVSPDLIEILDD